jgi:hypothetical protein
MITRRITTSYFFPPVSSQTCLANLSLSSYFFEFSRASATFAFDAISLGAAITAWLKNITDSSYLPKLLRIAPLTFTANADEEGNPGFQFRDGNDTISVIPWSEYKNDVENLNAENEVRIPLCSLDCGTSIAAPHVAGAAALYKSLQPSANPFQVDAFLKSVSTQLI